ncbi:MAG: hypothetical protein M1608_16485 [Candidatus Omnitrophica bacterium]|nr:hypothetical protein [Candidatus Omnitrophota bacterium]
MSKHTLSRPVASLVDKADESKALCAGLHLVVLCQDAATSVWARQVYSRVIRLVGHEWVRRRQWNIAQLEIDNIFQTSLQDAIHADIIIVSMQNGSSIPPKLKDWMDSWLSCRDNEVGALIALVGAPSDAGAQPPCVLDYLQQVAQRGGLDFFPQLFTEPREHVKLDLVPRLEAPDLSSPTSGFSVCLDPNRGPDRWGINE